MRFINLNITVYDLEQGMKLEKYEIFIYESYLNCEDFSPENLNMNQSIYTSK